MVVNRPFNALICAERIARCFMRKITYTQYNLIELSLMNVLDEVVEIERPGSATSQRSNVDLFSTEVSDKQSEEVCCDFDIHSSKALTCNVFDFHFGFLTWSAL